MGEKPMLRREAIKWITPVIAVVALPAHALTSSVPPDPPAIPTTTGAPTTPEPSPTLPPDYCSDGDVMMCRPNETGIYNTVCVHPDNVDLLLGKGYTLGMCPINKP